MAFFPAFVFALLAFLLLRAVFPLFSVAGGVVFFLGLPALEVLVGVLLAVLVGVGDLEAVDVRLRLALAPNDGVPRKYNI